MNVSVRQVDAFTTTPFTGNPAGVVLDASGLTDVQMQLIAREMNVSETAYLLPASRPDADHRIRWFTPSVEVDLCGHGTVACLHAAMEEGLLGPGSFRLECLAGVLPVTLGRDAGGGPLVRLGLPVPELTVWNLATCRLAEPLGLETDDIDPRLPVMRAGRWAVVPLMGLEAVRRMRPDFRALRALEAEEGVEEFVVLTRETVEEAPSVHLRMFAPALGIDEDPVTGTAQGPVAAWLAANRLIGPPAATPEPALACYIAEQGDELSRPGRIEVEVGLESGRVTAITIAGSAVTVMTGTLRLAGGSSLSLFPDAFE